jgi:hemolysin activation/secretion protein
MSPRHAYLYAALSAVAFQAIGQTSQFPADELKRLQERNNDARQIQQDRSDALRQRLETAPDVLGAPINAIVKTLPKGEQPCFLIEQIELRNSAPEQPKLIDIANAALAGPDKSDSPLRKCIGTRGTGMLIQRAQDALIAQGFVTSRVLAHGSRL